ncbi:2-succinylbenzoate--CoA ligase [Ureibacillus acetophenoni]
MEKLFLQYKEQMYSYEQFLIDLQKLSKDTTYIYIKENHPYQVFLTIIHSLVHDYQIELLDGDFSENELTELGIEPKEFDQEHKLIEPIVFNHIEEVIDKVFEAKNWRLTLYTSGTTGRPKKISHTFETLTRNVKRHSKFKNNIWAYAYNPTHMAGLQVFFQAFINLNPMIYVFGQSLSKIPQQIRENRVTNISATSTFYRNLIPYLLDNEYPSVSKVTFGGEKYDASLEERLHRIFPNAKLINIYASTEVGSLFTARGDIFELSDEQRSFIRITDEKELCIHESLLGNSNDIPLVDGWFHSGDLIEMVDDRHFKFLSRQSELINVGGYKVNPLEVENLLVQLPGVVDVLAKSKKNSVTGELLVVDVVKNEEVDEKELKKEIKKFAATHLQEWKVPRIIKFVEEIPRTRTGKKARK